LATQHCFAVRFRWNADATKASPQSKILLQDVAFSRTLRIDLDQGKDWRVPSK
jgi:hypothetical protein